MYIIYFNCIKYGVDKEASAKSFYKTTACYPYHVILLVSFTYIHLVLYKNFD